MNQSKKIQSAASPASQFPPKWNWIVGTLTAFGGTALVRLLAEEHYWLRTGGFAMGGLGLLIIAIGFRNRTQPIQ